MRGRTRRRLAWSLWFATVVCCAAGLVYPALTGLAARDMLASGATDVLLYPMPVATIGLVVALRRPGSPFGWLYSCAGVAWSMVVPWDRWLDHLVAAGVDPPVGALVVAVAESVAWGPAVAFGLTLPALLLPDGRLRSRRWRLVLFAAVAAAVLIVVAGVLTPGPLNQRPIDNPLGLGGVGGAVAGVASWVGVILQFTCLPVAAASVLLRFKASRGVERQQMRWVATGAAASVLSLLGLLLVGLEPIFVPLMVLCPVAAVAIAVLRYRLWDLERLVSRTITYALVTGALTVPYLLLVPLVTRLAADAGDVAVAAATLAAAALFQPVRRRVQQAVDQRFNRRRYDAVRTIEVFAGRLREQLDPDALGAELLAVVDQTVQPRLASLWVPAPAASGRAVPGARVGSAVARA